MHAHHSLISIISVVDRAVEARAGPPAHTPKTLGKLRATAAGTIGSRHYAAVVYSSQVLALRVNEGLEWDSLVLPDML